MIRKKIVFLISSNSIGGFETKLNSLVTSIDKTKFDLSVFVIYPFYKDSSKLETLKNYFQWNGIKTFTFYMNHRFQFSIIYNIVLALRKNKPDILYFMAMGSGTFIAPLAGKLARIPIIIRASDTILRGLYPKYLKLLDQFLLSFVNFIVVPSEFLKNLMITELQVRPNKMIVIPNGINLDYFSVPQSTNVILKKLGLNEGNNVVGIVANLSPLKKHFVLINAIPKIIDFIPTARFLIIGEGSEKENLIRLSKKLNVTSSVQFLGYRSDINELISIFDVGVLCSQVETFGYALIEMMASGVPVVASAVGGILEIINHNINGLLFQEGDSDALAELIIKLLSDRKLSKFLSEEGLKTVREKYTQQKMIGSLEKLFITRTNNYDK